MKLASIEIISDIRSHKNADRLDIAKVLGWQSIVKKGEFSPGEKVVFVVIDTILPDADWSAFLKDGDKPIRLRTVKLRNEYSQGLVLPLSVLPENVQGWQVGADVGAALGVKKYEKEIPTQLSGEVKCTFPEYLTAKTDEDNGLSNPDLVEAVLSYPAMTITQKLDGSSMTIIVEQGNIEHVCSRRMSLVESGDNAFWRATKTLNIPMGDWVVQGELMGPGIQGNQLNLTEPKLFVYQIKRGIKWLDYTGMVEVCRLMGAQYVPGLAIITQDFKTVEDLQALADRQTLPDGSPAEGIVIRPADYPASGIGRPIGFKIINRNYGE